MWYTLQTESIIALGFNFVLGLKIIYFLPGVSETIVQISLDYFDRQNSYCFYIITVLENVLKTWFQTFPNFV